ncbi:MAG: hypothetical protein CMF96_05475 [Candidatus Marinimicrobia bacterium]|nr:hypothetical protein [Candidatus Neomarinimicrobiota bacterium]
MFGWFKKQKDSDLKEANDLDFEDQIEEALWDVKEQFDLETEEVQRTVLNKRQNLDYMRKTLKRNI